MAETTLNPRTKVDPFEGLVSPQLTPAKNNQGRTFRPFKTGISVLDEDQDEELEENISDIGSNYGDGDQANTGKIHNDIEYEDITDDTTVPYQDAEEVLPEDLELKKYQEEAKKLQDT
jgi:hypothetical protein